MYHFYIPLQIPLSVVNNWFVCPNRPDYCPTADCCEWVSSNPHLYASTYKRGGHAEIFDSEESVRKFIEMQKNSHSAQDFKYWEEFFEPNRCFPSESIFADLVIISEEIEKFSLENVVYISLAGAKSIPYPFDYKKRERFVLSNSS